MRLRIALALLMLTAVAAVGEDADTIKWARKARDEAYHRHVVDRGLFERGTIKKDALETSRLILLKYEADYALLSGDIDALMSAMRLADALKGDEKKSMLKKLSAAAILTLYKIIEADVPLDAKVISALKRVAGVKAP